MKVLGIVCSPRKGGNTEILVREALEGAGEVGGETELILVADKNIAPCDACDTCRETGVCRIKDDMQPIYQQLDQADGIILGTPDEAIDQVGRYERAGMARVLIAVRPPLDWDALEAWAAEVIPAFD